MTAAAPPPSHIATTLPALFDSCLLNSREDAGAAKHPAARKQEAAVAAVRSAVVRRLHHPRRRQRPQGRHPCVSAIPLEQLPLPLTLPFLSSSSLPGFVAFDAYRDLLADDAGKVSGPANVLAGFGAGVTESVLAVTPFESIKTQLIDDRKLPEPRMRGFLHGASVIAREKGIRGFFQGLVPTTARQAANSATRFGSYTFIKQLVQEYYLGPNEKVGAATTFGIGALAGLVTVYVTMPLDTVKTRMQSIDARKEYRNSAVCVSRIFREEGFLTFWSGAVPRLARVVLSGGIVFTLYEKSMETMEKLDPDGKYI